jgi:TetR/AcrR family tetracycline transcriptional repressor
MSAPALTRQKVVGAALRLLDEVGLDGLSTRRLAAELGVKSPALYWHFRGKQELLDEMAATLLLDAGMGGPRADEPWRDWLTRRAQAYRRTLLAHRDGARLMIGADPGPAVVERLDEELSALVHRGFPAALGLRAIAAVSHYTTGFVLQEQARRPTAARLPPPDRVPTLTAALAAADPDPQSSFDGGLTLVLDGIAGAVVHTVVDPTGPADRPPPGTTG